MSACVRVCLACRGVARTSEDGWLINSIFYPWQSVRIRVQKKRSKLLAAATIYLWHDEDLKKLFGKPGSAKITNILHDNI